MDAGMTHHDEDRVSSLDGRVASLESDVANLTRSVDRMVESVDRLSNRVTRSGATNWGVLGTWAGVLLTACALVGGLVAYGLNTKIDSILEAHQRHVDLPGHPWAIQQHARHEERFDRAFYQISDVDEDIKDLDTVLQREMRLLDQNTVTRLTDLDVRLQNEMDLKIDPVAKRVDEITARLRALENRP